MTQVFIFVFKPASDAIVLYLSGIRLHSLGLRSEGVFVPYFVVRILVNLKYEICRENDFSINLKTSFMSSGDKLFLTLKISKVWRVSVMIVQRVNLHK